MAEPRMQSACSRLAQEGRFRRVQGWNDPNRRLCLAICSRAQVLISLAKRLAVMGHRVGPMAAHQTHPIIPSPTRGSRCITVRYYRVMICNTNAEEFLRPRLNCAHKQIHTVVESRRIRPGWRLHPTCEHAAMDSTRCDNSSINRQLR